LTGAYTPYEDTTMSNNETAVRISAAALAHPLLVDLLSGSWNDPDAGMYYDCANMLVMEVERSGDTDWSELEPEGRVHESVDIDGLVLFLPTETTVAMVRVPRAYNK
jgi:hypothetical protein